MKDWISPSTAPASRYVRAALISADPKLRTSIIDGLAGRAEIADLSLAAGLPGKETVTAGRPDLCFIDVGAHNESLGLIRQVSDSGIPVAALHVSNDSDLILRSFRCGASEFLFDPIRLEDLSEAFDRLLKKSGISGGEKRPGRVITVMPAKPGYGATTISCNLALRLAPATGGHVLLADTDPLLGSISFSLKLKSPFSFIDVMNHGSEIDNDLWRKIVVPHEQFDVLLGPEVPRFDAPSSVRVPSFLRFVRANYATVVLDSPGPLSEWHLTLANSADEILLVTTNELAAVHATLRTIQLLQHAGADRNRIRLIVNRYESDNGLVLDAIETALKMNVYWTLPNDYAPVQQAVLDGKMVSPSCRLGQSLDELVEHLTGVTASHRRNWKLTVTGFFSRKGSKG